MSLAYHFMTMNCQSIWYKQQPHDFLANSSKLVLIHDRDTQEIKSSPKFDGVNVSCLEIVA